MSLYKQFKTDERLEKDGIFLEYGSGGRFKVARAGATNLHYKKACERIHRKYHKELQLGIMEPAVARRLYQEIFVDNVILGWEGVKDEAGNDLPFTRENCLKLFEDLPEFWLDIQEQAQSHANFRAAEIEADAKNS